MKNPSTYKRNSSTFTETETNPSTFKYFFAILKNQGLTSTCKHRMNPELCYEHAIHLAPCDVLYKNTENLGEITFEIENILQEEDFDESEKLLMI